MTLPVIDISPLIEPASSSPEQRASTLSLIRTACLDKGFFLITAHGVPIDLQQRALSWSRRFFDLPLEDKLKLSENNSFGQSHRGYQRIGGEAYEESKLPDLKEVSSLPRACLG